MSLERRRELAVSQKTLCQMNLLRLLRILLRLKACAGAIVVDCGRVNGLGEEW